MTPKIDARNGCYGNEEASGGADALKASVESAGDSCSEVSLAEGVIPAGAGSFCGDTIERLDTMARRALAANRVIDRIQPCPSGADCLSGQKHERIFACEFCENFKGCSDCVAVHEAEAHWTDSDTAREMHS